MRKYCVRRVHYGLLLALVIALCIYQRHAPHTPAKARTTPVAALAVPPQAASATGTASAAQAAQAVTDAASVLVEQGVVKFYFASGKADLAAGAADVLVDLVKAAKSGRRIVVSGFHDASGDAAKNAALARQRAMAVRDALLAAGVAKKQIELKKPEVSTATGSNAEARRVEISVQ